MRIYDKKNKKSTTNLLLMLTQEEIIELIGALQSLNVNRDHVHIDDEQFKRKITIGLYSPDNINHFNPDVIHLIETDK